VWATDRCVASPTPGCLGSKSNPVRNFDADGNEIKSFGAGLMVWPHGIHVDRDGNVWVTYARIPGADPYQPKRVRTVPEVVPDPSRHSSVDRGPCVLPGDVRGVVWLAVYRDCSSVDVALVYDPVPHGDIGPDRPAK
jgi:hypothetical protein